MSNTRSNATAALDCEEAEALRASELALQAGLPNGFVRGMELAIANPAIDPGWMLVFADAFPSDAGLVDLGTHLRAIADRRLAQRERRRTLIQSEPA